MLVAKRDREEEETGGCFQALNEQEEEDACKL